MIGRSFCAAAGWAVAIAAAGAEFPVTHTLPAVVVASRFEHDDAATAPGLTVIGRDAITKGTARTVAELLSQQAGVQVRDSTGGPDPQIDLRGFGQNGDLNTTVLIDGQRFNDIDMSTIRWSAIPLSVVERIEILRGSGAVLYGGGATGGVINIVTRRARAGDRSAEIIAGTGSYDTLDLQGAASLAGDVAGLRVNVSDYRSDNYRDNNRLRQRNLLLDIRTLGGTSHVYAKIAADSQDLRNPGQLTLAEMAANRRGASTPLDYSSRDGSRLDIGGVHAAGPVELAANLAYRLQASRARFTAFGSDVDNETDNIAFSPRARIAHRLGGFEQSMVAGIDLERGRLDRDVTGVFFSGRTHASQERQGIYARNSAALAGGWTAVVGARAQRAANVLEDLATAAVPLRKDYSLSASELVLRRQLSPTLSAYGRIGRSFRLPSVEETNFSSPALLEPQTSNDREAGLEARTGTASGRLSFYRMDLENEIAFNPILFDNVNLAPTRREGGELEARARFGETVETFLNYSHVIARFRTGVYGGVDLSGNAVPLVPRHALAVGVSWRVEMRTRVNLSARYVGEQRYANDETNALTQKIPAYTTVDLRLVHEAGRWQLEAGVRNLLGAQYFTQGGVSGAGVIRVFPAAERNAYVSFRQAF